MTDSAETRASFGLSPAAPTGTAILQGVIYYGTSSSNRIPNAAVSLSTVQTITADGNGYYKRDAVPAQQVGCAAEPLAHRARVSGPMATCDSTGSSCSFPPTIYTLHPLARPHGARPRARSMLLMTRSAAPPLASSVPGTFDHSPGTSRTEISE